MVKNETSMDQLRTAREIWMDLNDTASGPEEGTIFHYPRLQNS